MSSPDNADSPDSLEAHHERERLAAALRRIGELENDEHEMAGVIHELNEELAALRAEVREVEVILRPLLKKAHYPAIARAQREEEA